MDKLMELIEQHPELKEAYDKLVELKGKLNEEEIMAFIQEHLPAPGDKGELSDDDLDGVAGGFTTRQFLNNAMDKAKKAMQQLNPTSAATGAALLGDLLSKKNNIDNSDNN